MEEDTDEKDDTKRKSRNLSEKKRRDQFNLLVNELSSMVSSSNRKMDKSTVLKSTIAFLKNHNEITVRSRAHEIQEDWKPAFLSNEEFTHLILEALDGFMIVFSSRGNIIYTSESITSLLGHLPGDLQNMTIYDLSYEDDHTHLYNLLLNPSNIADPLQNGILRENQIVFSCHLKRGGLEYREKVSYELVQFTGYFRSDVDLENMLPSPRSSSYHDPENRLIFVGTGRLQIPQLIREMSIIDSVKSEFTSRHSLEWKFLFLDHRAPPIIGYLPFEVLGTSGYDYYHFDDLEKVVACHESLLQKGEGTSCYYRFLTKGQQWIWLQTRFYITYHQWNSKPEFVVCTHRVVNYSDVMKNSRIQNSNSEQNECMQKNNSRELVEAEHPYEKHLHNTMSTPFWNVKNSSRISRISETRSPNTKVRRQTTSYYSGCGSGTDSTSHSTESMTSKQSHSTQYSVRSKIRHSSKRHSQSVLSQNQQQSLNNTMHNTPQNTQMQLSQIPSQQLVHQHSHPNLVASSFLEPPQYLATIPVQPVITPDFSSSAAVISTLQPPAEIFHPGVVMTPAQNQIQDQLQRKHEELQHLIVQQQEELRRVSEQLLMARYGLLPAIVNVSLPFTTTIGTASTRLTPHQQQHDPHHLVNLDHICGNQSQVIPSIQSQPPNLPGSLSSNSGPNNEMMYIHLPSSNQDGNDTGVNQQPQP